MNLRLRALIALLAAGAAFLVSAAPAAAASPAWRLEVLTNTTAAPGGTLNYMVQLNNVGDVDSGEGAVLSGHLPAGITATAEPVLQGVPGQSLEEFFGEHLASCSGDGPGAHVAGGSNFSCTISDTIEASSDRETKFSTNFVLLLSTQVGAGAPAESIASFEVEGGGAAASFSIPHLTQITAQPPGFGIEAFDAGFLRDAGGDPDSTAATHPYGTTTAIELNTLANHQPVKGDLWPVEPLRDVVTDLPPGLVGSIAGTPTCQASDLAHSEGVEAKPLCLASSQVGVVSLRSNGLRIFQNEFTPIPLYNLMPPPGIPARFGFNFSGVLVTLDAHLRSSGDYGLTVQSRNVAEGIDLAGTTVDFWGVPAAGVHDPERDCAGEQEIWSGGPSCPLSGEMAPFLRMPTSCDASGLATALHADSWQNPGGFDAEGEPQLGEAAWQNAESTSHALPGYPYPPHGHAVGGFEQGAPVPLEGCEAVPFEPEFSLQPTTDEADSPTGLDLDIGVPQQCWDAKASAEEVEDAICQSDLRTTKVQLPAGVTVNPSSASGLGACSAAQIGLFTPEGTTPIHIHAAAPGCPESSKIGSVEIESPLIKETLTGSIYLAAQGDNPFKSLLAFYIVAHANGITIKLPAHVETDAAGRLTTVVDENPQLPFSQFHLQFSSGQRAPLLTPPACGEYASDAALTPWSHDALAAEEGTPIANLTSSFQLSKGPGGSPCPTKPAPFAPKLSAGTQNPLAGSYSPLAVRLSRGDGSQRLAGLSLTLPPGLSGRLDGIPYCPDAILAAIPSTEGSAAAQLASPACPAASQVGTVTVGAGAGADPFFLTTGRDYLAGPYKGAPLSLAIITPALAGPFDLGNVVVRAALRIDPETAQVTAVSDPLPSVLDGIPLDLRDIHVDLNRPEFALNPTSCEEMGVGGTAAGTEGASASLSDRFQVSGCERLPFKPKLTLRLKGPVKRTANPRLIANLTARPGEANIARTQVKLPPSAFLDNAHIGTICTRVQFEAGAGGGAACPSGSVYGHVSATTPLLGSALSGNVYLRANPAHKLPDLVAALRGPDNQPIEVDLASKTDAVKGALRTTFEAVPDVPVTSFRLELFGGNKGLIEMSSGFCDDPRAAVNMTAQNGKLNDTRPMVKSTACGNKKKRQRR